VFFETFGGAVLGATIDKFVYVSVNRLSEFFDYKVRISYSKAELRTQSTKSSIRPSAGR
jgi:D-glycero-alpha-D-manno-heptose-7-phosphate kinase